MPRPRTVLSPEIPRATKTKAEPVEERAQEWRSRPTAPGMFSSSGMPDDPFYGDEAAVRTRAEVDARMGAAPVVEQRIHGAGGQPPRTVPSAADLVELGEARAIERNATTGRPSTVWISPAGQARIFAAMGLA